MNIYFPKDHCNDENKNSLFPLLDYLANKKSELINPYYVIIDNIELADIVILPLTWNYYIKNNIKTKAVNFIEYANSLGKKVYTYNAGDCGVKVPNNLDIIIFRACGFASKKTNQEKVIPFFLTDPLVKFYNQDKIVERPYSKIPTVGFCGLANTSKFHAFTEMSRIFLKNMMYYLGLKKELPQIIQSTVYNRSIVLKKIEKSDKFKSNFIWRKKYRAGAFTLEDRKKTTLEYYQNLKDSDYIVCIRGAGNFSVRLYETLAMGRIPIFINTDCMLPLADKIEWKKYMVWVEYDNLDNIEELVLAHYNKLNNETLNDFFQINRSMWLENFGMIDFFKNSLEVE